MKKAFHPNRYNPLPVAEWRLSGFFNVTVIALCGERTGDWKREKKKNKCFERFCSQHILRLILAYYMSPIFTARQRSKQDAVHATQSCDLSRNRRRQFGSETVFVFFLQSVNATHSVIRGRRKECEFLLFQPSLFRHNLLWQHNANGIGLGNIRKRELLLCWFLAL